MPMISALLAIALAAGTDQPGPKVGEALPAFTLSDHTGTPRDFASLSGPKGLVLVFYRSADW